MFVKFHNIKMKKKNAESFEKENKNRLLQKKKIEYTSISLFDQLYQLLEHSAAMIAKF